MPRTTTSEYTKARSNVNKAQRLVVHFIPEHVAEIERRRLTGSPYPESREQFLRKIILQALGIPESPDPKPASHRVRAVS